MNPVQKIMGDKYSKNKSGDTDCEMCGTIYNKYDSPKYFPFCSLECQKDADKVDERLQKLAKKYKNER